MAYMCVNLQGQRTKGGVFRGLERTVLGVGYIFNTFVAQGNAILGLASIRGGYCIQVRAG